MNFKNPWGLFSNRGGPSRAYPPPTPYKVNKSTIMAYVSAGAPSYFKATNRQYDIMLVDPRGVPSPLPFAALTFLCKQASQHI